MNLKSELLNHRVYRLPVIGFYLSAMYTPNITRAPPIMVNSVIFSPNKKNAIMAVTTGIKYRNIATFEAFSDLIDLFQDIYANTEHKSERYKIEPIPSMDILSTNENFDSKYAKGNKKIAPNRKENEVIAIGVLFSIVFFPAIE